MAWSKWIEEAGLKARLYRWGKRPALYYDFTDPLSGRRTRRSTKRVKVTEAESWVKEVLRALAEGGKGRTFGEQATLGDVFRLFFEEKAPHYRPAWRKTCEARRALFEEAWGTGKRVADIGQADVDRYADLRRSGKIHPEDSNVTDGVRDTTIEADIRFLSTVLRWAHGKKVDGRRLVPTNPLDGLNWPEAKDVRRPIASHDRYTKTLAKADEVDPMGRLACMLTLARYTGRRESAICGLMASDLLRTPEAVRGTLAAMGQDERRAAHFPHGGLRWRADTDKQGYDTLTPLSEPARAALDVYLERNPRVGEVPMFPAPRDEAKPIRKDLAGRWLRKAEKMAGLPKLAGGRWHPYRRLFATELKTVPIQDVAAAGGWKSVETVRQIYQQA
ncbi:MAG TPA: tyrosine-type recombinase/integrase, partial [Longimicrobiales bacterium]|nr:tyrosine-type recombinase/integrase [Longimicrobiales bacterium]